MIRSAALPSCGLIEILFVLSLGGQYFVDCAAAQPLSSNAAPASNSQLKRPSDKVLLAITSVLETQAQAWNRGDIDGFMQYYWNSDQMCFCSGGNRTFGWAKVAEQYKKKYSSPELMGKLKFDNLDVKLLSDRLALAIGDWHLHRLDASDNIGGNFTLILERQGDGWRIIHDHTSSRSSPSPAD